MHTIKQIIADIIAKEGGYVNHKNDKGGPTNYGITAKSYAEYYNIGVSDVTVNSIKAMTKEMAEQIYLKLYYKKPHINCLPELIQPIMLDMAVNHGRRGAVKILQKALAAQSYSFSSPDGIIGAVTLAQSRTAVSELGRHFIASLVEQRIDYYNDIIRNDPSQAVFKNGWIARAESFRPELV